MINFIKWSTRLNTNLKKAMETTKKSYWYHYFKYLHHIDKKEVKILHLGCGWDKRGLCRKIRKAKLFSLDIDIGALQRNINPLKINGDGENLPFKLRSYDYVVCEDFIEHVQHPGRLLNEINRVLKTNGEFIFVTPNGWSYIAIVAKITPFSVHKWYNRLRGVLETDVYPTYYRFNSLIKIKSMAKNWGFDIKTIKMVTGNPSYFNFSKSLSLTFRFFHHILGKIEPLNRLFGINIFCILRKNQ